MFYSSSISARAISFPRSVVVSVILLGAIRLLVPEACFAVTIDWSPVGNAGNAPDPLTGLGAVPYSYNIATYDVTVSQYVEFLNAKDPTGANALGLYNSQMSTFNLDVGTIDLNPSGPLGDKYVVRAGKADVPAEAVTWIDAIRFANWLSNGQGNGDTETGSYTVLGGTSIPTNIDDITRNSGATIVIPNDNEWYKAAYYNPVGRSYYLYGTSSNTAPIPGPPSGMPNHANVAGANPYFLQETNVGAYSGTTSPYGAFDMAGNVFNWTETAVPGSGGALRPLRGGGDGEIVDHSLSTYFLPGLPATQYGADVGFRLAMIPEPSTLILAAIGGLALLAWRQRA